MALFVEMTLEVHQKILILVLRAFFLFPTNSLLQLQLEANPEHVCVWCGTKLSFESHCCRVLMNIWKKKKL